MSSIRGRPREQHTLNGLVSSQVLIGNVSTQERRNIDPESVESGQTESRLRAKRASVRNEGKAYSMKMLTF